MSQRPEWHDKFINRGIAPLPSSLRPSPAKVSLAASSKQVSQARFRPEQLLRSSEDQQLQRAEAEAEIRESLRRLNLMFLQYRRNYQANNTDKHIAVREMRELLKEIFVDFEKAKFAPKHFDNFEIRNTAHDTKSIIHYKADASPLYALSLFNGDSLTVRGVGIEGEQTHRSLPPNDDYSSPSQWD